MRKLIIITVLFILALTSKSQEPIFKNMTLNGYVKYMNTAMFNEVDSVWLVDNMIHNRLNFRWYMNDNLTLAVEARNRFIYGDLNKMIPGYADMIEQDNGLLGFLTTNLVEEKSFLLNTSIDRAYIEYNKNSFTATSATDVKPV